MINVRTYEFTLHMKMVCTLTSKHTFSSFSDCKMLSETIAYLHLFPNIFLLEYGRQTNEPPNGYVTIAYESL